MSDSPIEFFPGDLILVREGATLKSLIDEGESVEVVNNVLATVVAVRSLNEAIIVTHDGVFMTKAWKGLSTALNEYVFYRELLHRTKTT